MYNEVEEIFMKTALSPRSEKLEASRLVRPHCPQCGDQLFASSVSVHVNDHDIRHWWNCESCGHEFMTRVRLRRFVRSRTFS